MRNWPAQLSRLGTLATVLSLRPITVSASHLRQGKAWAYYFRNTRPAAREILRPAPQRQVLFKNSQPTDDRRSSIGQVGDAGMRTDASTLLATGCRLAGAGGHRGRSMSPERGCTPTRIAGDPRGLQDAPTVRRRARSDHRSQYLDRGRMEGAACASSCRTTPEDALLSGAGSAEEIEAWNAFLRPQSEGKLRLEAGDRGPPVVEATRGRRGAGLRLGGPDRGEREHPGR